MTDAVQSHAVATQSSQSSQIINKDGLRVYRNGALADPVTGRIVGGTAGGAELARRRWERAQAEARQGMAAAGRKLGHGETASAAWRAVCEHAATQAMTHPTPRESVVAAKFVGQAAGFLQLGTADASPGGGAAAELRLSRDALELFLDRLAEYRRRQE